MSYVSNPGSMYLLSVALVFLLWNACCCMVVNIVGAWKGYHPMWRPRSVFHFGSMCLFAAMLDLTPVTWKWLEYKQMNTFKAPTRSQN